MSDGPSRRVSRPAGGTTENLAGKAPTEDLFADWDMSDNEALVAGDAPTTAAAARPAKTAETTASAARPAIRPSARQAATRPRPVSGTQQRGSPDRQAAPVRRREQAAQPAVRNAQPPSPPQVVEVVDGAGFTGRFAAALLGALVLPGAVAAMSWPAFLAAWTRASGVETVSWQLCAIASSIAAAALLLVVLIAAAQGRSRWRSLQTAIAWSVVLMLGLQAWQRYGDTSELPPPARMAWVILDPIASVAGQELVAQRQATEQTVAGREAEHAAAITALEADLATARTEHTAALQAVSEQRDAAKASLDAKTAEFLQMQVERDQLTARAAELEATATRAREEAATAIAAATAATEKARAELATAQETLVVQAEVAEKQAAALQAEIERLKQALVPKPPPIGP